MLNTSDFSICNNVFKSGLPQRHHNAFASGKELRENDAIPVETIIDNVSCKSDNGFAITDILCKPNQDGLTNDRARPK